MTKTKLFVLIAVFVCFGLLAEWTKNADAAFLIGFFAWPLCASVYRAKNPQPSA